MFAILGAVIGVVVGLAIGALLGYSVRRSATRDREAEAEQAAAKILVDAQAKEKETLLSAKEEAIQLRAQAEQESKARRDEVLRLEQRVANREETLDRKLDALERRETAFAEKEQQQEAIRAQLDELRKTKLAEVERVSGMTSQEARVLLLRELEDEIREEGNRLVRTIDRLYLLWVVLSLGIPFAIGGLEGLVWGGLIRIFAYQHATFSVNSICHMFGRKDYRSRDEARNNWLVALLVFGEGWHNNHHAFPSSARHGLGRLQIDVSWWVIRGLEKLRLVWDVKVPDERQRARRRVQPAA